MTTNDRFDHLFLDAGAGMNVLGGHDMKVGLQGELNIGDWITPEHGLRMNLSSGVWQKQALRTKYMALALDYMLNITALAQPGVHYTPKRFEVYGIAGLDYAYSRQEAPLEQGIGAHLGLRGQLALSRSTYFYMEPRMTLIDDDATQSFSWHGYRPVLTANIGFGYRLPEPGDTPQRGRLAGCGIARQRTVPLCYGRPVVHVQLSSHHMATQHGRAPHGGCGQMVRPLQRRASRCQRHNVQAERCSPREARWGCRPTTC